ncbi:HAD-IIB family hydrolase [Heliomarina baculiformis]|uniref:HAD-IIB family hydrolase n=1 Tax=Heliomarina baculiformis TaxID=2872036 RepID=UPI001EE252B1|nr:HAD-IIB family hydrolase [Heliomarina baculiformis]
MSLPDFHERQFVLATDLDGTFLGGTDEDRRQLYDWIEDNRDTVGLIFVSGRDPEFMVETCSSGDLPWPEYVIGDVGTTIAKVEDGDIRPIEALEQDISGRWSDSGDRVRTALADAAGLRLQETPFRYRVSYHYDPASYDPAAADLIGDMGLDVLISDNRFFDVLPPGVSKGPSLLRLLDHLGVPQGRVLASGDTLNDLSMLIAGTYAVAVGGSEQPLLQALPQDEKIHRAKAIGAAGIAEAMTQFNLHPGSKEILKNVV